jgi:hypothetical protein
MGRSTPKDRLVSVSLDLSRRPAPAAPVRPNLAGLTRPQLQAALVEAEVCPPGKARMRANQLWRWIHHYGVTDFERMTDVGKEARVQLADAFTLARPEVVERQASQDGTRKVAGAHGAGGGGRDRVHPRRRAGGGAVRVEPGGLHA